MPRMELLGKRKRRRPKSRFMVVVREDMVEVEVTKEDAVDRTKWRWEISYVDPGEVERRKHSHIFIQRTWMQFSSVRR